MPRIFGALAIFGGWLSILVSVAFGLAATQFLGLDHIEGDLAPQELYGIPAIAVMWIAVAAAIVTSVPAAAAILAPDPSRRLRAAATVMVVGGIALLPDQLGRAYAAALIPGGLLLAAGGWWIHNAGAIGAEIEEPAGASDGAAEPAPMPVAAIAPVAAAPAPAQAAAVPAQIATPIPAQGTSPTIADSQSGGKPMDTPGASGKKSRKRQPANPVNSPAAPEVDCPWCSARIAAGAERCPSCGAALVSAPESTVSPIFGVTSVRPELREYQDKVAREKKRPGLLSLILGGPDDRVSARPIGHVDPGVLGPPSDEVRAEMERLDREIAAGAFPREDRPDAAAPATAASDAAAPKVGPDPDPTSSSRS